MFGIPVTIVMIQMIFTIIVILTLFPGMLFFGSCSDLLRWAKIIPLLYAFMLTSSLLALDSYSMGAMVVVRNIGPLFTMLIENAFQEQVPADMWTWLILLYILSGAVLYIDDDISFSPFGLVMVIMNMIVASVERLMQRRLIAVKPVNISKLGMLLVNNAVGSLYVSLFLFPFPEYNVWQATIENQTMSNYALLLISCIAGAAIGWSAINAQAHVSATTMLVLTNLNKVVVVVYGMIVLGETSTVRAVAGCAIVLSGGLLYAQDRQRLEFKKEKTLV